MRLKSLWQIIRVKTLVAAIVPVAVAHCLVIGLGHQAQWWVTLCAVGGALAIQIATNILNDAIDFRKGADTAQRLGPQRVTQSGQMSSQRVLLLGVLFLLLAVACGLPLVWRGGLPILGLGLLSLFLAYAYTGGPWPLAYLGLGDLFVVLFFGLFAVVGTFYLQTLDVEFLVVVAGLQVGFLATNLLALNNLRDSETDQTANKRTLAVRFGDNFVRWEVILLTLAVFALNVFYRQKPYVNLSLLVLPLGLALIYSVWTIKDKVQLNRLLGRAALLQLGFGFLLGLGLLL